MTEKKKRKWTTIAKINLRWRAYRRNLNRFRWPVSLNWKATQESENTSRRAEDSGFAVDDERAQDYGSGWTHSIHLRGWDQVCWPTIADATRPFRPWWGWNMHGHVPGVCWLRKSIRTTRIRSWESTIPRIIIPCHSTVSVTETSPFQLVKTTREREVRLRDGIPFWNFFNEVWRYEHKHAHAYGMNY